MRSQSVSTRSLPLKEDRDQNPCSILPGQGFARCSRGIQWSQALPARWRMKYFVEQT